MIELISAKDGTTWWFNPHHIVLITGTRDNVHLTVSTGWATGHPFRGEPAKIANLVDYHTSQARSR